VTALLSTLIALAAALAGVLAALRARGPADSPRARLRRLGAAVLAALAAAWLCAWVPLRPAALLLAVGLAALLGMAAADIAGLTLPGIGRWRRRLLVLPGAFGAAVLAATGEAPTAVLCIFLLPATLALGWLDKRFGLRARALLLLAAILTLILGATAAQALPPLPRGLAAVLRALAALVFSFATALTAVLLVQFPGRIFDRFRLRTRLITSYIFVGAIPALLLALFVACAAYMAIGSYRALIAARLLEPGVETERGLDAILADPALDAALGGPDPLGEGGSAAAAAALDALARRHLVPPASFLVASRRQVPDTTRFTMRFAPRGAVPQEIALLREPLPPTAEPLLLFAGDRTYIAAGAFRTERGAEIGVRAFAPLDSGRVAAVGRTVETEIQVITTDSLTVEAGSGGIQISFGEDQKGRPVRVAGSAPESEGAYSGAQILPGLAVGADGRLHEQDAMVVVKTPLRRLFADLRNTADKPLNQVVLIALGILGGLVLLVEIASIAVGVRIARSIHGAVSALHQGTRKLAEDELDHRIDLERGDELGELADAFNAMAQGLAERRRLAVEREAMKSELLVAQSIQRRLFPAAVPEVPGLDVAGTSIPSREIGGDSYDFLSWRDGLLVSVADVAGKGVPAALLMSNLQAGLRGHAHRPGHLNHVLGELNELVLASTEPGRFITAAIVLVEPQANRIVYANAGHNPPLLRRADGSIESLVAGGLLLGVAANAGYEETAVPFRPGDVLVLYTDGVVEAQNAGGEFFEEERLVTVLAAADGLPAATIRDHIVAAARDFAGEGGLGDDLTVVVVRRV
jgi:serine phosphatase RsbU (regulator of sigma subunit)